MSEKEKIEEYGILIHDILLKIEEALYLLKDGKQILANNKLSGIKQKLAFIYKDMLDSSGENTKNT